MVASKTLPMSVHVRLPGRVSEVVTSWFDVDLQPGRRGHGVGWLRRQMSTCPSLQAAASRSPAGLKPTAVTPLCRVSIAASGLSALVRQIRTVRSRPPLTSSRPSGLNASDRTVCR